MKKWTTSETVVLKQNMDTTLSNLKTLLPERTEEQIIEKIRLLYRQSSRNRWTSEELDILRDNGDRSIFELMKLLPDRTFTAISYRVYMLNGQEHYKPTKRISWNREELERLKQLKSEGYTNYEIAEMLKRPLNSVIGKLYTTNEVKRVAPNRKRWTTDEIQYVNDEIRKGITVELIASKFGVTVNTIYQRAIHLGIKPSDIHTESKRHNQTDKALREQLKEKTAETKRLTKLVAKYKNKYNII